MDSPLISRSFDDGGASTSGQNGSRSNVLERKRPPRLHLKQDFPRFNEFANDANQKSQDVSFQGDCYGVWSRKGKRLVMEDTFVATSSVNGDPSQAFFGVFDGHGGTKAAEFAAGRLMPNILQSISNKKEEKVEEAVKSAYLLTDKEFCQEGVSSGASCVTALVTGGHILVANAGDCRAVLSRNGDAVPLTKDHLANREDEQRRIVNLGGYVDLRAGCWRVQGTLAVSRSIGDAYLKKWVCAEPDVSILSITPEFEFIILASDGLWHMVKNQEAVDCARHYLKAEDAKTSQLRDQKENNFSGALDACKKLVETAIARGCLDDITVVVIKLNHFRQAGDNGFTRNL